jgi:host factor-I protein
VGLKRESMSARDGVAIPSGRSPQLQDTYLAEIRRQAIPVVIYLVNGFQLRGTVKGFDSFTIVLEYERKPHLIYKHAVSTISPQGALVEPLVLESTPPLREAPEVGV